MSGFHDDFKLTVDDSYEEFGVDAIHIALTELKTEVVVIISHDLAEYFDIAAITANTITLAVRKEQLRCGVSNGDTFSALGKDYIVQKKVADTEHEMKFIAA